MHMPTDARSPSLLLTKFLRMNVPMATLTTKRAVVVICTAIPDVGGVPGTEARVITLTDSLPTAWLRLGFEASLLGTPICTIEGSRGFESVSEIFPDLLYRRKILPRKSLIL